LKKLAAFIIATCILLSFSCETDHQSQKYLLNLSGHTLKIDYLGSYSYETSTTELLPQDSVLIKDTWGWGCRDEQNLPSCVLEEMDSVLVANVSDSTLIFTGDFTDENRWHSQFTEVSSSTQTCTFAFVNNDFIE
tara:strand:+ start:48 stop:452 length:405 start_codon:yes stop_codon:yes gene_type:complete